MHNKYTEDLGKFGVLTKIASAADPASLQSVAKSVCIQVMSGGAIAAKNFFYYTFKPTFNLFCKKMIVGVAQKTFSFMMLKINAIILRNLLITIRIK